MQRDADALLFLEFKSENTKGILTGKLFEYMFVGVPIIAVGVAEDSSVGPLLRETGRGKCLGDSVERIAEELREVMSMKSDSRCLASTADYRQIEEFSREEQSKRMLSLVS